MSENQEAPKTLDAYFCDWEASALGFGYGSGEAHVIPALRAFMGCIPNRGGYDYTELEARVGPEAAWLLINLLCHQGIIEYGSSPRFGWLTPEGKALQAYILSHTPNELVELAASRRGEYVPCYPDHCNCDGARCDNPFWAKHPNM